MAAGKKDLVVALPEIGAGPSVTTDPPLLRVLISNLLDNAVRHSPDAASIEVVCTATSLRVTNPCPGLTQADIDRAFEPFVQLGPSGEGVTAGVGLTLCREIASVLGMRLQATVSDDQRVTFAIDFDA
jgi:signal transduction histidine kinase